jgi:hypothetical protein
VVVNNVAFVYIMKLFNNYFFTAIMLGLSRDWLILHLALQHPAIYNTCSDLGLIKLRAN